MKKNILGLIALIISIMIAASCNNSTETKQTAVDSIKAGTTKSNWGVSDGKEVLLFTLTNKKGVEVKISNYGATVTSWVAPDKKGDKSSIVLGFDSLAGYLAKPPYFGATVGRYGNRIANGKFKIDGNGYTLATNNGKNHLHGGLKGFDKVVWEVAEIDENSPSLTLHYLSKDGEEGYPGNLHCTIVFTLSDDDELGIEYSAETDKPTVLNLTNHSYFNLTGNVDNSILKHTLKIDADRYTPVDTTLITTGELKAVTGTPFDFTKPAEIGSRIDSVPGGYDHNFVLNRKDSSLQLAAVLSDTISGRTLEVFTTEPGIQFYTGNFLDGSIKTDAGKPITKNSALCLETQHFPDSPNKPKFPTTVLRPGQKYHTVTRYKLSVATN